METCAQRKNITHLIYAQYVYGNKTNSQVTEFKKRNGFQQVLLPRYYIPLNAKGKIAIALRLHRGAANLLPEWAVSFLLNARLALYQRVLLRSHQGTASGKEISKPS